jgi:outer membrane protein
MAPQPVSFPRLVRVLAVTAAIPFTLGAQQPTRISLDDAIRMAIEKSDAIAVIRAGVSRADAQRLMLLSINKPQLSGTASYSRALASQFQGLDFGGGAPPMPDPTPALCAPRISATATAEERLAAVAQAQTCAEQTGGGFDFGATGFGAKNTWTLGLQFTQTVWDGGRVRAQLNAADAQMRSTSIDLDGARASVVLETVEAYFDWMLADQLVALADSSVAQADVILRQTRQAREQGVAAEFDMLRAQVTRDNLVPMTIQARSARQLAYDHLKLLLDVPVTQTLQLTTALPPDGNLSAVTTSEFLVSRGGAAPDTSASGRAAVRQLEEAVRAQEALLDLARLERKPTVAITSGYQRLYFPSGFFPDITTNRQNLSVGLSSNFSILNGGRVKANEAIAAANLDETKATLRATRKAAELSARMAMTQLQEAEAVWRAGAGTVEQAQRAYAIDQVRFREGISTQTDIAQSRLLLEQATANRARAARNLAVARANLQLLRDLPITTPGGGQQQPQGQQQNTQQQSAPTSAGGRGGPTGSHH